jgi:hypothetical protein
LSKPAGISGHRKNGERLQQMVSARQFAVGRKRMCKKAQYSAAQGWPAQKKIGDQIFVKRMADRMWGSSVHQQLARSEPDLVLKEKRAHDNTNGIALIPFGIELPVEYRHRFVTPAPEQSKPIPFR